MDPARLLAFSLTFFVIAASPGLCMTLAMSLGISIGVRRTLWMMLGELVGITLVGAAALGGVAALMLSAPEAFTLAKLLAAAYLMWCAVRAWRSPVELADGGGPGSFGRRRLILQGFVTAASNPKAWVFFAALLPPFIDPGLPLAPQAAVLLAVMILIEFLCLLIYAQGGKMLRIGLLSRGWGRGLNRVTGGMLAGVAIWLLAQSARG